MILVSNDFMWFLTQFRNSHRRCSVNKGVLKNFANFTRKHLFWRTSVKECFYQFEPFFFYFINFQYSPAFIPEYWKALKKGAFVTKWVNVTQYFGKTWLSDILLWKKDSNIFWVKVYNIFFYFPNVLLLKDVQQNIKWTNTCIYVTYLQIPRANFVHFN